MHLSPILYRWASIQRASAQFRVIVLVAGGAALRTSDRTAALVIEKVSRDSEIPLTVLEFFLKIELCR
jgi:hypothetical protein